MNTTAAIDLILSHGDMKTTFKLAVLTPLVRYPLVNPGQTLCGQAETILVERSKEQREEHAAVSHQQPVDWSS